MKPRFSLRMLFIAVAAVGSATFVMLHFREWRREYRDWRSARDVRERAAAIFHDETKQDAPADLVNILGSGELSHWGPVHDVALVGDHIISCGDDRTVRIWSAETGEPLRVYNHVDGHIASDSSLVVMIDDKQQACVYDTAALPMKTLNTFSLANESKIIWSKASDVGPELAVAYENEPKTMVFFDMLSGARLSTIECSFEAKIHAIGFREDGRLLAVNDYGIRVIDSRNGVEVTRMNRDFLSDQGPRGSVPCVARLDAPWWFLAGYTEGAAWNEKTQQWLPNAQLPSGGEFATATDNGGVCLASYGVMSRVSTQNGQLRSEILPTTPLRKVSAVDVESSGGPLRRRAVGYGAGAWSLGGGQVALLDYYGKIVLPAQPVEHIHSIAWSADSDRLAAANTDGEIVIYSVGDWHERARFAVGQLEPMFLEFSPDGSRILSKCAQMLVVKDWQNGAMQQHDTKTNSIPATLDGTLASGDGRLLACIDRSYWELLDVNPMTVVAASDPGAPEPPMGWRQGPEWLESEGCFIYFAREGVCRLKIARDAKTKTEKLVLTKSDYPKPGRVLDYSQRDQRVLMSDQDRNPTSLYVWDWEPSKLSVIRLDPSSPFRGAALFPGKKKIAALLGGDLVVMTNDGEELYRKTMGSVPILEAAMQFSPDGRYLAIVNGNGTCYLFKSAKW